MKKICLILLLTLMTVNSQTLKGPFIFWGNERLKTLQPQPLILTNDYNIINLYKNVRGIIIFVRNSTEPFNDTDYPKFQELLKEQIWNYLPQRYLKPDPVNYNPNVEIVQLKPNIEEADLQITRGYNFSENLNGKGTVLGIFASHGEQEDDDDDFHYIKKREAQDDEPEAATTTAQTLTDETDKSFVYVADGNKAVLAVGKAPILNLFNVKEALKLEEHNRAITFDDQKTKVERGP